MITREQALADIALADTLANEDIFEVLCKFRNDGSHERTLLDFITRARAALPEYAKQYIKVVDLLAEIYFDSDGVDNKIRGKIQAMVVGRPGRPAGHKGKAISPDHRAKISASLAGRKRQPMSAEQRAKISANQLGRTLPLETRLRMSAAQTRRQAQNRAEGRMQK